MEKMLEAALAYAEVGNRVLPVYELLPDGTCACTPAGQACKQGKPSKHPRIMAWQEQATTDEDQVTAWWTEWPRASIGVAVPPEYVVFDVDPRHGGTLAGLGEVPETVMAATGGGGWHVWFALPDRDMAIQGTCGLTGIDVRKAGNYVLVEPSRHASCRRYTWKPGCSLLEQLPALIPPHLLQLIEKRSPTPTSHSTTMPESRASYWLEKALERVRDGVPRNESGFWLACQLRDHRIESDDAAEAMTAYHEGVPQYPDVDEYTLDEAMASLRSAYAQPAREPARRVNGDGPQGRGWPHGQPTGAAGLSLGASSPPPAGSGGGRSDPEEDRTTFGATSREPQALHSASPSDSHSYSWRTAVEQARIMERAGDADALDMSGDTRAGSRADPAWQRRQAQYPVLLDLWRILFPQDELPRNQMNTWFRLVEPGHECELVADNIISAFAAHQKHSDKPINSPRKYMTDAIAKALDPEHGDKRRARHESEGRPATYTPKPKAAPKAQGPTPAPQPESQPGQPTRKEVEELYRAAGFDPRRSIVWPFSPERALKDLERYKVLQPEWAKLVDD
jgi:hypothetical protein